MEPIYILPCALFSLYAFHYYSHLLAMTLAEEDEKRYEREKEWEDYKTQTLGAGGDSVNSAPLTE